ncbi:S24 family peptidase [Planktosalinus lacus]|uniref:SOS-response transcriptional regulator UmuD-like protein n=1 Tax=Planktosalinus lacus TaxID=1526573 RepID=A0A8J2V7K4_9FLAO|nr:S24 family peptidase [Planktosalinus lacus]GGD84289.1 SOS-response transcriptional regulator UmuD-like protein [Planktosalinus lacus]
MNQIKQLKKKHQRHTPEVSKQTGFPSAATHYAEQPIDLHDELVDNRDATFFIRVKGRDLELFRIYDNDVLIVDRSRAPQNNRLAVVVEDGDFFIREIQLQNLDKEYVLWGVITYIIHKV